MADNQSDDGGIELFYRQYIVFSALQHSAANLEAKMD